MAAVPVPEEFTITLKPAEMATLMTIIATSPVVTQSDNNAKFIQNVDKELSRYYTLAELGVLSTTGDEATLVRLFSNFQAYVQAKMEATKAKLCPPLKS
jgi:hypothetical protein